MIESVEPRASTRPRSRVRRWALPACVLLSVLCGATGVVLLSTVPGPPAASVVADGVPMLEVSPPGGVSSTGLAGGVVVVHGFAGSADLMRGFADTLALRGYVVVLPDLPGHGTNTARLSSDGGGVDRAVAAAVQRLRTGHGLSPDRIALVGHSLGAGAVTRYASAHPEIGATVALSLGGAAGLPADPRRPRNLLLLVGAFEFPGFRTAALDALHRADPLAQPGTTIGDPRAGTGRRAVIVTGTEHISILYAARSHIEMARWLDAALPGAETTPVATHATDRVVAAGLLLVGFVIGFIPLAIWLVPVRRPRRPPARTMRLAGATAVGCLLAVAAAQYLPTTALPLAVGGYAAGFFVVVGLSMIAGRYWAERRPAPAPVDPPGIDEAPVGRLRLGLVALALVTYAAAAVAVPIQWGLTHAVPVGPRWWLLPVMVASVTVLLLGVELAWGQHWWARSAALGAVAVGLLAAVAVGSGPSFVVLVLPLLVVLFAWYVGWSTLLSRRGAPAPLTALIGVVLVAWPIAHALPLV